MWKSVDVLGYFCWRNRQFWKAQRPLSTTFSVCFLVTLRKPLPPLRVLVVGARNTVCSMAPSFHCFINVHPPPYISAAHLPFKYFDPAFMSSNIIQLNFPLFFLTFIPFTHLQFHFSLLRGRYVSLTWAWSFLLISSPRTGGWPTIPNEIPRERNQDWAYITLICFSITHLWHSVQQCKAE